MTLYDRRKEKLIDELKDKEYRDAFVAGQIEIGIPFQIKALREQRKWTQKDIEKYSGMNQATISLMENHGYSTFTLSTLKKFASAYDIGLVVRFVPISELVDWELNLSPESLEVLSYEDEPYFKEKPKEEIIIQDSIPRDKPYQLGADILHLAEYKKRIGTSKINEDLSYKQETDGKTPLQQLMGA